MKVTSWRLSPCAMKRVLFEKPAFFIMTLGSLFLSCQPSEKTLKKAAPAPPQEIGELAYFHTERILEYGPRPAASQGLAKVRAYLSTQLQERGWDVSLQRVHRPTPKGTLLFENLRARLHRPRAWEQPIEGILCAHMDSKEIEGIEFLGADDAASAVGMILALLDHLPKEALEQLELVFFDGEEGIGGEAMTFNNGLYGSKAYARMWQGKANKPKFGLLLDMIGHDQLRLTYPSDSPPELIAILSESADSTGFAQYLTKFSGAILDDHVPLNLAGIPTINMIGDFTASDWWHQKEDNLSLISKKSLSISGQIIRAFLLTRLKVESTPASSQP